MNVGYDSTNSTQVARQVQDMVSRGFDGVIIDWYGKGTTSDSASLAVMKEAEAHPGFTFAIMVDKGAISSHSCSGCTAQQALVKHLQYIEQTYLIRRRTCEFRASLSVTNFDVDADLQIDWNAAESTIASGPTFLFQSNPAFTHAVSSGGYSWVQPKTTDYGSSYLTSFYKTGKSHTNLQTVGASPTKDLTTNWLRGEPTASWTSSADRPGFKRFPRSTACTTPAINWMRCNLLPGTTMKKELSLNRELITAFQSRHP